MSKSLSLQSITIGLGSTAAVTSDHGSLGGLTDDDHSQYALLAGRAGGQTLRGGTNIADVLTIADSNGNEVVKAKGVASAVNEVTVTSAATGGGPVIAATGGDTDIGISVSAKAAGVCSFNGSAFNAQENSGSTTFFKSVSAGTNANYLQVNGATTTNKPSLEAKGSDTNVSLNLVTQGSGTVQANGRDVYYVTGTDVAVTDGGTGASDAATAATNLGLGTGDSPQFTAVNIGHASDTTVARVGAGDISVEGNLLYRAGGTDVPIADGGTGASTATAAFDALAPTTTQGDVIYHNGTDNVRLAAGTAGQMLKTGGAGANPSWSSNWLTVTLGPFYINDLPATATTTASLGFFNTATAVSQSTNAIKMTQACTVVGLFMVSDAARTTGTATARVRVSGTGTAFNGGSVQLNGTDTTSDSDFVLPASGVALSAGQTIGVEVTTSSWGPTTADISVWVVLSMN